MTEDNLMSLRDRIAVEAMAAIIAKIPLVGYNFSGDVSQRNVPYAEKKAIMHAVALGAYDYADAMLEERGE